MGRSWRADGVATIWAARGADDRLADLQHAAAVQVAIDAATTSGDPLRASAAQYARRLTALEQARDTLLQGGQAVLAELAGGR